ncbi:MAG TPA: ABC transporter permease [Streptosporangiaceae bacterium]|nr:ABC transporter permease [Streptosporangiaceae bacterium]
MSETIHNQVSTAGGPDPGPLRRNPVMRTAFDAFMRRREATILLVALGLVIYFQSARSEFLSHNNLVNLAQSTAPYAIVAVGQVLLLVSGEIDLSAGATFTFAPFMMHYLIDYYGVYPILAIPLSVLVGAAIGFGNGFITVVLKVPSFVTTLGMLFLVGGLVLTTSHAFPAQIPEAAQGKIQEWFGQAEWSELVWCLLIVAFFHIVLTRTRWGLHTIAVGGNLLGAGEAGIKTTRIKIGNFMITGGLAAFAGIMEAFRTQTIDPSLSGADFASVMFTAVSAAVIGGTALAGGSGTVIGALLGAFVLAELRNGFNLIGISANPFNIILGLAILGSMILNVYLANLRRAGRT